MVIICAHLPDVYTRGCILKKYSKLPCICTWIEKPHQVFPSSFIQTRSYSKKADLINRYGKRSGNESLFDWRREHDDRYGMRFVARCHPPGCPGPPLRSFQSRRCSERQSAFALYPFSKQCWWTIFNGKRMVLVLKASHQAVAFPGDMWRIRGQNCGSQCTETMREYPWRRVAKSYANRAPDRAYRRCTAPRDPLIFKINSVLYLNEHKETG